ncbi:MAG: NAD(P)/FAD-dependent oxidoreductase [Sandaracinaceae bacterium]
MSTEHFDVLIVGAGISGIGAAHHLGERCPGRTYAILEGRDRIGGTWDLFRYPGIRSDSDMHTLGFRFKPWEAKRAIADGDAILDYLDETAREGHIDEHIRFGHHVDRASWSSEDARWTVEATKKDGEAVQLSCNFLFMCSGYYDYAEGHAPRFEGQESFEGPIVHPQHWPKDLDYAGKKVVVIGSGATAVTLVPAMAETAAHVTMLQRTPTYIAALPWEDAIANALKERLSPETAYAITRWKNILMSQLIYTVSKKAPDRMRRFLEKGVREHLGDDYPIEKHFRPPYGPWDQRLCLAPDGDFFVSIREGKASVVTDHIDRFTTHGIRLKSGEELEADIIVSATGLKLQFLGGVDVHIDGEPLVAHEHMSYKAMMVSDVPNLAFSVGYTNASWTLKADLTSEYVCRLLNHMEARGYRTCTPRRDPSVDEAPFLDFSSGYVKRALHYLPKQGQKAPWKVKQNYFFDMFYLRHGKLDDGVMRFA